MNTTTQTPEMHPNARELAAQIEADAITELSANAFAAYNVQAGGKTWDGKDIPPWEKTGEKVQANWRAALRTTLAKIDLTRLVHFHGAEGDPLNALLVGDPSGPDNRAALHVFYPDGAVDTVTSAPFSRTPRPGHWTLPQVAASSVREMNIRIDGAVFADAASVREVMGSVIARAAPTAVPVPAPEAIAMDTPVLATPEDFLKATDPDPSAKYSDDELRVARALYTIETAEHNVPTLPVWDKLKVGPKRALCAAARKYLASREAEVLRVVLKTA